MIIPLRAGTLGFISAISRSILAIAMLGLLGELEESGGNGGGSTKTPTPSIPWGQQPVDYTSVRYESLDTMDACMQAVACGMI